VRASTITQENEMRRLIALTVVCLAIASGAAAGEEPYGTDIQGNALASKGGIAATNRSIAVDSIDVSVKTVDNSIRQVAIMKDDVNVRSAIVVTGDGALKTIAGSGNGSIGGGISVSAIGAANSISTTTTGANRSGRR
jgi:hypothetical protein